MSGAKGKPMASTISTTKTDGEKPSKSAPTKTASEASQGKKKKGAKKASSHIAPPPNLPAFMYKDGPKKTQSRGGGLGASRQGSIEDLAVDKSDFRSQSRISQRSHISEGPGGGGGGPKTNIVMWLAAGGVVITIVLVLLAVLYMFKGSGHRQTTTSTPTGRADFDVTELTVFWVNRNGSTSS